MTERPETAAAVAPSSAEDLVRDVFQRCELETGRVVLGWTVDSVQLADAGDVACASFTRGATSLRVRFRRAGEQPRFARIDAIDVAHDKVDPALNADADALLKLIVLSLQRGHAGRDLFPLLAPRPSADAGQEDESPSQHDTNASAQAYGYNEPSTRADTAAEKPELNLYIGSSCTQRCQFCSIPIRPFGTGLEDGQHQQLVQQLESGRARGANTLRVNGIEPLNYPLIVELIEAARHLGFEAVVLFTTAVPLADLGFTRRIVAALPQRREMQIPLYGASAAVHDEVTASPGSFENVVRAMENLRELLSPDVVRIKSVIVRANLHELAAARDLAASFGFGFDVHMPFPNPGYGVEAYNRCAPTFTEAVRVLHQASPAIAVREAPPCVLWRHERETGVPSLSRISTAHERLEGRGYLDPKYLHNSGSAANWVVPAVQCPAAARCGLADRCTQEIYSAYADLHGLDEFIPVAPDEAGR